MNLERQINLLRFDLADAAQQAYEAWETHPEQGACGYIAEAIVGVLKAKKIAAMMVEVDLKDGTDIYHFNVIACAFEPFQLVTIDIDWHVYEKYLGDCLWEKIPDVLLLEEHISIDVQYEEVITEFVRQSWIDYHQHYAFV